MMSYSVNKSVCFTFEQSPCICVEYKNYFAMVETIVSVVTYDNILFLRLCCCFWYVYVTYSTYKSPFQYYYVSFWELFDFQCVEIHHISERKK